MLLAFLILLGIGNFAMHKAVLESGHPMVAAIPLAFRRDGGRLSLALEFVVLLAALLLAANGWPVTAAFYALYSLVNLTAGWAMLSGRI